MHVFPVPTFIKAANSAPVIVPAVNYISHLIERFDVFHTEFRRNLSEIRFLKFTFNLLIATGSLEPILLYFNSGTSLWD